MGLTYQEMKASVSDTDPDRIYKRSDYMDQAIKYHKYALAMAWRNYSRISSFGVDRNHYSEKWWENSCHLLATCMSDLGWAYVLCYPYALKEKDLDLAEYFFKKALELNYKMNSHCSCPELHWRLGVVYLLRGCNSTNGDEEKKILKDACDEFKKAIRINPEVMKYHFSFLVSIILGCGYSDKSKAAIQENMINLLEWVVPAYIDQNNEKDSQWRSLDELMLLLEDCCRSPDKREKYEFCDYFHKNLKNFLKFHYDTRNLMKERASRGSSGKNSGKTAVSIPALINTVLLIMGYLRILTLMNPAHQLTKFIITGKMVISILQLPACFTIRPSTGRISITGIEIISSGCLKSIMSMLFTNSENSRR